MGNEGVCGGGRRKLRFCCFYVSVQLQVDSWEKFSLGNKEKYWQHVAIFRTKVPDRNWDTIFLLFAMRAKPVKYAN